MERDFNEIPFVKDDINTLIKKLRIFVHTAQQFKPCSTNKDKFLMSIQSMSAAMISLGAEILSAVENGRIFVAASLACQLLEAEIQLLWFDKHKETNGDDFIDFGYVESIEMLRVHPDRANVILALLKNNNCQRFLRKPTTDDNELLKRENYRNHWHGDKVKKLSQDVFEGILEYVNKNMPDIAKYYDNTDVNYENYQLFCKFKHFAPYMVRQCFATEHSFREDTPDNTTWSVVISTLHALINMAGILQKHGSNLLNAKAVSTDGLTPMSQQNSIKSNNVF